MMETLKLLLLLAGTGALSFYLIFRLVTLLRPSGSDDGTARWLASLPPLPTLAEVQADLITTETLRSHATTAEISSSRGAP